MALINISNQYRYTGRGPFDAKALVRTFADLLNTETWKIVNASGNKISSAYNGMIVAVWSNTEDTTKNGIYFLYDPSVTSILKSPDVTKETNWHRLVSSDMTLLFRKAVFEDSYVLAAGEPGCFLDLTPEGELNTNNQNYILKVGDGKTAWKDLPFANENQIISIIEAYNYKVKTAAKTDSLVGAKVISTWAQNENGEITFEYRDLTPNDIGAQPAGDYKTKQLAVVDPIASDEKSITFIDTLSQNENGEITATKKTVDLASKLDANGWRNLNGELNRQDGSSIISIGTEGVSFSNDNNSSITTFHGQGIEIEDTDGGHDYSFSFPEKSGTLALDSDIVFQTDLKTVNSFGGIPINADLNNMSTHDILKKLLYPYVDADIGNAFITLHENAYEYGDIQTIEQVSIDIIKKSEPITMVALYNGSTCLYEKIGNEVKDGGTIIFEQMLKDNKEVDLRVNIPTEGNQLTVKVSYPDANGNNKTVERKTPALTFVYPYYVGTCDTGLEVDEAVIKSLSKLVTTKNTQINNFTVNNGHIIFAYPKSYGTLSSIIDTNNLEIKAAYDCSEVNVTCLDGTIQPYYVYVSSATTVTNFKVTFKHFEYEEV